MILKPIKGISSKINFSIANAENYISYSNEKVFENHEDKWLGITWAVKPFIIKKNNMSEFNFTIKINIIL